MKGRRDAKKRKKRHKSCRRNQALSFRTRNHLCRQEGALTGTRQLHLQGPVSVHAHHTLGVIKSEGREEANGGGGGIGVGGGNGDENGVRGGNRDVNGDEDGDGAGTGTRTGVEANVGAHDGDENGSGYEGGTGTGTGVDTRGQTQDWSGDGSGDGNESSSGDGNGDGNEDEIGEGGGEAKKRKKPHKSCRRYVRNGKDLGWKRKKRRQERVGSVAANPDNLENSKEARGEAQGTQGLSKNCTRRECVSPLSRRIRGFRKKYS